MPFTPSEFLALFETYNRAVFPLQFLLLLLAVLAAALAFRRSPRGDGLIASLLALFWLWTGIGYHLTFFSRINPAAILFGLLCVIQALLLLYSGVVSRRLAFRPDASGAGIAGGLLIAYALVIYPLLGLLSGHVYPQSPTFGAPCPTTIFTFGLLLWSVRRLPLHLLWIPLLWSAIGGSAAFLLGVPEDTGLLIAGLLTGVLYLHKHQDQGPVLGPA